MKACKILFTIGCVVLLSGCAIDDIMTSPYEDHPNLKAAETARQRGDLPQAIRDFRDIIREAPNCERAYIGLGMALSDANAIDEAKRTFEKTIVEFPQSTGAWTGMGIVYLLIDQPENAINAFDRALRIDARNAKAINGHGIALDMIGNHEGAQANYRAALQLDPNNISYESNLALSMVLGGKAPEAIHILERLARPANATPRVRQNLALAYGLVGDMKMARKVGRIDLSDDLVKNNINYFEAIQEAREYSGLIPKNHTIPLDETRKWQEHTY